jgi:hypothetical protein
MLSVRSPTPGPLSEVWLARIRRLASEAGEPRRFDELLSRVRQQHKPKRNLMALLDKSGL